MFPSLTETERPNASNGAEEDGQSMSTSGQETTAPQDPVKFDADALRDKYRQERDKRKTWHDLQQLFPYIERRKST